MQWLGCFGAGLSLWRPRFDPSLVHVGFVVDEVALGQVYFSLSTLVFSCWYQSASALYPLVLLSLMLLNQSTLWHCMTLSGCNFTVVDHMETSVCYWWQLMRRSLWGGKHVLWGAGYRWLWDGLLDSCWYKWQAVLLHTDRKRQAFRIVNKWTVYYIIFCVSGHIIGHCKVILMLSLLFFLLLVCKHAPLQLHNTTCLV
jgi:hypothetical protein